IYSIKIHFKNNEAEPLVWDSSLPTEGGDYEELIHPLGPSAYVKLRYQLHAYDKRQREEELRASRFRRLSLLAVLATGLALAWMVYVQRRESKRQQDQRLAEHQVMLAEQLLLKEEVRRQEAEHRQQQAERDLLQQRLAA